MKHSIMKPTLTLLCLSAIATAPVSAQGRLDTLPTGRYICALPGDATGLPVQEMAQHNFTVTGASSYRSAEGGGTYLRVGDTITFTRGPRKDMKLRLLGSGLLQWVNEDGTLGRIRCSRVGR